MYLCAESVTERYNLRVWLQRVMLTTAVFTILVRQVCDIPFKNWDEGETKKRAETQSLYYLPSASFRSHQQPEDDQTGKISFDTTIRTGTEESCAAETTLQGKLKFEVWFVFCSVEMKALTLHPYLLHWPQTEDQTSFCLTFMTDFLSRVYCLSHSLCLKPMPALQTRWLPGELIHRKLPLPQSTTITIQTTTNPQTNKNNLLRGVVCYCFILSFRSVEIRQNK